MKGSIVDKTIVDKIFVDYQPDVVVNLAAQAGVRYSISNPDTYVESNLIGLYNILEACRHSYDNGAKGVEHLVYASSSSVYGTNKKVPYSTEDKVDNPVPLYAATKKSNELMAHVYSKLYNIPSTGLGSLPYMVLPDVQIWRTLDLRINCGKARPFGFLTTETVNVISHM